MKKLLIPLVLVASFILLVPAALLDMLSATPDLVPEEVRSILAPDAENFCPVSGEEWICPVSYTVISSPFGWRIHPIYHDRRLHTGIDLAAPMNTPIYASRAGTVIAATYDKSRGNYVALDHGDGFETWYLHMTYSIAIPGTTVEQGQLLGYVGSTGTSTGPHLHLTIRYDGKYVDPKNYINF